MSDNQTNDQTTAAPEVADKPKLSRIERLTAKYNADLKRFNELQLSLNEQANEINAIAALAGVGVGTLVIIGVGRAETARDVQGVVVGVKEDEDGAKKYKVQYGEGFDADITVVSAGKIKSVVVVGIAEAEPVSEEQAAE